MLKKKSEKVFYPHLIHTNKLPLDFFHKKRKESSRGHHSQPHHLEKLSHTPTIPSGHSLLFTFRRSNSYNKLPLPAPLPTLE